MYKPNSEEVYSFCTQEAKELYVSSKDLAPGQTYLQIQVDYLPNQQYGAANGTIAEVLTLYFKLPKYLQSPNGNLNMTFFDEDKNLIRDYDIYRGWIYYQNSGTMHDSYKITSERAFTKEE